MYSLSVNVFPAGFIWPLWVGQEKGIFAANELEVVLIPTRNSIDQMGGLIDGKFDIAMTAIDNVIAYMEGQGEAETTNEPDITAVMGSSNGFLSLIVTPDIKTMADLKGARLSVDALTTGYSFTLRRLLEVSGLRENEYELVPVGGMKERYESLLRGEYAGTLSVPPFTVMAKDQGFHEITTVLGLLGHFQGGVAAVRREWAAAHGEEITRFIRANIAALAWLCEPANKREALEIFHKHLPGVAPDIAEQSYAILLDPVNGFSKDCEIDIDAVRIVMDIRSQFARPYKPLLDPGRYIDLTYYERAVS